MSTAVRAATRARPRTPGRRPAGQRVVVLARDRVAQGQARRAERPQVEGDAPRNEPVEGRPALQERAGPLHLQGDQRAHLRGRAVGAQIVLGHPEARHVLARQVDAVAVAQVAPDVLPEVHELEPDAGGVAHPRPPRVAVSEHAQDHLAHGGGRVAAVVQELVVGVPARPPLVHAVGLDQPPEGVEVHPPPLDRVGQRDQTRVRVRRRRPPGRAPPPRRPARPGDRPGPRAPRRPGRPSRGRTRRRPACRRARPAGPGRRPRGSSRRDAGSPGGRRRGPRAGRGRSSGEPGQGGHGEHQAVEVVVDHEVRREPGAGEPGLVP